MEKFFVVKIENGASLEIRADESLQLAPGDKLYLYTDGVTEATDNNNQLYGEQRLLDFVNSLKKVKLKYVKFSLLSISSSPIVI
jgi:serine phosphatase RsbU (regulator of sigma subunit)